MTELAAATRSALALARIDTSGLVRICVVLIVLGLVWYLVEHYVFPHIAEPIKLVIRVVLVLALCLWLLSWAGIV